MNELQKTREVTITRLEEAVVALREAARAVPPGGAVALAAALGLLADALEHLAADFWEELP